MLKKIAYGIVIVLALMGATLGTIEGYKGVVWIRASHAKSHAAFDFLAQPVGQTKEGRTIVRGDILEALIQQKLAELKGQ